MGYIGSHTVVELIQAGFEVVIIDNLCNSNIKVLDGIEGISGERPSFEEIDLCDSPKLKDFFNRQSDIVAVIHFAALKSVGESVREPLKYYQNNLIGTINLLSQMKENRINNLVFSSSCTVYGKPDKLPVTEKTPIKPATNAYGRTKQICEDIIRDTGSAGDLNSILLRYFNPVGAHESCLLGELPVGAPENLVPYLTQTVAGVRDELSVFGNDYDTPDGTGIRDYIHVVDLAKAHVVSLNRLINKNNKEKCEVFNLGAGRGYSVLELINTFDKINGEKVKYKIVERRPGDIEAIYADASLANIELGWKAGLGLEDMLRSAWEWEKKIRGISN